MSVNGARSNNNLFLMMAPYERHVADRGTVNADSMGVEGIREFTV